MSVEETRSVGGAPRQDDDRYDKALRPRSFEEYVGQSEMIANLKVFVTAASKREEAIAFANQSMYGYPGSTLEQRAPEHHAAAPGVGAPIDSGRG